jgi:hypothetical protein
MALYRPIEISAYSGDLPWVFDHRPSALDYEMEKISQLWCEVLRIAVYDVMRGRYDAIHWLHSRDFETVCDMANIHDADSFRMAIIRLQKQKKRAKPRIS